MTPTCIDCSTTDDSGRWVGGRCGRCYRRRLLELQGERECVDCGRVYRQLGRRCSWCAQQRNTKTIVCRGCGRERKHKARGFCAGCYDRESGRSRRGTCAVCEKERKVVGARFPRCGTCRSHAAAERRVARRAKPNDPVTVTREDLGVRVEVTVSVTSEDALKRVPDLLTQACMTSIRWARERRARGALKEEKV